MYTSLALHNFRSYGRYALELSDAVNIVVGPNGSGKTNLLEALYVLSTGSSFRGAERDLIAHGSDWFRLEGMWDDQERTLTYQMRPGQKAEKQFSVDGAKKARITHSQRVPVVLFEPDHLRLLKDSPSLRRDYLDGLLVGLQPDFSWLKHQFERVLLQRNNLLKRRLNAAQLDDSLFVWDIKFAELARLIVERRVELVKMFESRLSVIYSTIAHAESSVAMQYVPSVPVADYQAQTLKLLRQRRSADVLRGFTTIGPQRDDFRLVLNGSTAETSASRGEVRSLLLALKVAELELLESQSNDSPLLLLDDVFSELDASRRQSLVDLTSGRQTVITTTDADIVAREFVNSHKIIRTV